jgi:hypothetical protein
VHMVRHVDCSHPSDGTTVPLGVADCAQEFSYSLAGSPTAPMCIAASSVLGSAMPTGGVTLCCL